MKVGLGGGDCVFITVTMVPASSAGNVCFVVLSFRRKEGKKKVCTYIICC